MWLKVQLPLFSAFLVLSMNAETLKVLRSPKWQALSSPRNEICKKMDIKSTLNPSYHVQEQ